MSEVLLTSALGGSTVPACPQSRWSHFQGYLCNEIRDVLQFMTFPFVSASAYNCFGYSSTSFLILKMCALYNALDAGFWIRCSKIFSYRSDFFFYARTWIRFSVLFDPE